MAGSYMCPWMRSPARSTARTETRTQFVGESKSGIHRGPLRRGLDPTRVAAGEGHRGIGGKWRDARHRHTIAGRKVCSVRRDAFKKPAPDFDYAVARHELESPSKMMAAARR